MSAGRHSRSRRPVRARAPLRLGLAGGGTDLSPYCDRFGGSVLNVAISRYAVATLCASADGSVRFISGDLGESETLPPAAEYDPREGLMMHRAIYNRIVRDYNAGEPLPLFLHTIVECPIGAGLGASSSLVVAGVAAFQKYLGLPLGEFELAHLAFEIERIELGLEGGKQDQYAAAFGGVNFMEFASKGRVIVNPLRLDRSKTCELEANLLLAFTGSSRNSSDIIREQIAVVSSDEENKGSQVELMHVLKRDALEMKAALLSGDFHSMARILRESWETKKKTAVSITNANIDRLYAAAMEAGASAAKISGAGGGGFMMILVDPLHKRKVATELEALGCNVSNCSFAHEGAEAWHIKGSGDSSNGF